MKILVFSDSHRALGTMYDAIERLRPDAVLHLGDHLEDAESLESVFSLIAGWVLLGQRLSVKEQFGCLLVFAAIILAQIPAPKKQK